MYPDSHHTSRISVLASGSVHFGQIPGEHWHQPAWINETKAREERDKMDEEKVIYGSSLPCDFFYYIDSEQG